MTIHCKERHQKEKENDEEQRNQKKKSNKKYNTLHRGWSSAAVGNHVSLLRMTWSWKEFAVLMPVLLISVTILILFFYANDGFVDDYEIMMYYDEEDELDEDE